MKRIKILVAALIFTLTTQAQTIDSLGNYHLNNKRGSEAKKTGKFAYDSNGVKHDVYISKNGKLFVKMVSKKTNKEYNKYLN
jgi:hypothetical protein